MTGKKQLRPILILCLLALSTILLSAVGPLAAGTDAFTLTTNVSPPGSGTVSVNPPGPYQENDVVSLTATAQPGYTFDRWVLNDSSKWWDTGWDYRVEVTSAANGVARRNKPAEFPVNFTQLWQSLGTSGTLDPNSIRVVEVDGSDNVIDDAVPFQFDRAADYHAANKAAGTVVLIMKGNTGAGATRLYHIYFDVTGKGFPAPNVPAQVTLNEQKDEAQDAYRLVNNTGTQFIHKHLGGVSSYNDANGNDWVSWNKMTGSSGANRGIPNVGGGSNYGIFHPGTGKTMTPTIVNQGPIKVTLHFVLTKGGSCDKQRWEGMYEIYPDYTTFTLLKACKSSVVNYPFWFLYEGTPGGQLDLQTDLITFSDGKQIKANQSHNADLGGEEWAYVTDPNVGNGGRSIFFVNETGDQISDYYTADGSGVMTILGFGRGGATPLLPNDSAPRRFIFGLMNETAFEDAKSVIHNAYQPLNADVGVARARAGASLGNSNPAQLTITGDHSVTAVFKAATYTVTVGATPNGVGTVTKSPNNTTYNHGDKVTLTAEPTASGYHFAGWTGDATGMTNPIELTVTKNMVIIANFAQTFTVTTSANPPAGGSVTLDPAGGNYAPGTQVTISATANSGYTFTGWSGDAGGTSSSQVITVNGNMNIIANFGQGQYTFNATSAGNGAVDWTPKKALYAPGEQIAVIAIPDQGYTFSEWTGDIQSTVQPLYFPIQGNTTVVGHFVAMQSYTVNVTVPGGGGSVNKSPAGPTYPTGTDVTLTAVPDAGKRFVQWGGDLSGTELEKTVKVTSNLNITATFADDGHPLNVTISPANGGVVFKNPDQTFYAAGTSVTLTAVPETGFTFAGWSGAATGTNPSTTVVVPEGGASVTATFNAPGPFTLNVTTGGTGTGKVTVSPVKTEYAYGEIVKLTAVPDANMVFDGWSGDASGAQNPLSVTMNGDKDIVALFKTHSEGPFSDQFDSCELESAWQWVNPLNDGTFRLAGTTLEITVPEGTSHNVWRTGNDAPRVMQSANHGVNGDFDYIVKFDSEVTQNAQMQGLVIEETAERFARFDFEFNGSTLKAYAATLMDGSSRPRFTDSTITPADAVYMRVSRTAGTWAMYYSSDGETWKTAGSFKNFELNVQRVGLFAGNVTSGGQTPAHTAVVDYFHNVAQGPMAGDRPLLDIKTDGSGSVSTNPPLSQLACGQTVTLTASPGLNATFSGWSGDVTGTQPTVTLLLTGPKTVTATFTGSGSTQYYLLLPSVLRSSP